MIYHELFTIPLFSTVTCTGHVIPVIHGYNRISLVIIDYDINFKRPVPVSIFFHLSVRYQKQADIFSNDQSTLGQPLLRGNIFSHPGGQKPTAARQIDQEGEPW